MQIASGKSGTGAKAGGAVGGVVGAWFGGAGAIPVLLLAAWSVVLAVR